MRVVFVYPSSLEACGVLGLHSLTLGGRCGLGSLDAAVFRPPLPEPRLFYDVASAGCHGGPAAAVFACSDGGVTRFQAVQKGARRDNAATQSRNR